MNQKRRRTLEQAVKLIAHAAGDLEQAEKLAAQVRNEEKIYRSRLPAPLQNSSKAKEADEALALASKITSRVHKAISYLPEEPLSFAAQDAAPEPDATTRRARDAKTVLADVEDMLKRQRPKKEVLALIQGHAN